MLTCNIHEKDGDMDMYNCVCIPRDQRQKKDLHIRFPPLPFLMFVFEFGPEIWATDGVSEC